jgi:hypothetical protein
MLLDAGLNRWKPVHNVAQLRNLLFTAAVQHYCAWELVGFPHSHTFQGGDRDEGRPMAGLRLV